MYTLRHNFTGEILSATLPSVSEADDLIRELTGCGYVRVENVDCYNGSFVLTARAAKTDAVLRTYSLTHNDPEAYRASVIAWNASRG